MPHFGWIGARDDVETKEGANPLPVISHLLQLLPLVHRRIGHRGVGIGGIKAEFFQCQKWVWFFGQLR